MYGMSAKVSTCVLEIIIILSSYNIVYGILGVINKIIMSILLGFRKKVLALAKQKDCQLVGEWERSLVNHLYWCVVSTADGDG